MSFHIVNLGCKVNRVESDAAASALIAAGHEQVDVELADIIVVNTCTVTGEAEKKTRKAVRRTLSHNTTARVVVTGCAAAMTPEVFEAMDSRVRVVPKAQLEEALREETSALAPLGLGDADSAAEAPIDLAAYAGRSRVGVKVQDGCNNACTYCIVHVARGAATSRPFDRVVADAVALARAGVNEIVLTGINLGTYDDGGATLADLLRALLSATSDLRGSDEPAVRFRIGSVEPCDVSDDLVQLMAASDGRICRHLHLPLQSGSSKVLAEMNRPYDAAYFCDLVARMRAAMPQLSLSTDIIAGFPGETENDFQQTCDVARTCGFVKIHAFPYSMRAGTPAALRTDQVPQELKAARAKDLRILSNELARADLRKRVGETEYVLVEGNGLATAESYHVVRVDPSLPAGALVPYTFEQEALSAFPPDGFDDFDPQV